MLTQKEIAKFLGVSQPRVSQLFAEGCPNSSIEAVEKWRQETGFKRVPTNTQTSKFADDPPRKGRKRTARKPSQTNDSLLDALKNAIAVSDGAFLDYEDARVNRLATRSIRLSEHNKAVDMRLKAEKAYREELERRKLLVPIQEAMDICRRTMEPVLRRLKKIPQEVGPQCNPQDPLMAVKILEAEINSVIAVGRKALNALKS